MQTGADRQTPGTVLSRTHVQADDRRPRGDAASEQRKDSRSLAEVAGSGGRNVGSERRRTILEESIQQPRLQAHL